MFVKANLRKYDILKGDLQVSLLKDINFMYSVEINRLIVWFNSPYPSQ